ncbi:MAG: hypothetical protein ACYDEB_10425 [Dehalococcoidia bacterium]
MAAKTAAKSKRTPRRQRGRAADRATGAGTEARARRKPNLPDWKWRTFPVFAAFVAGLLVDSVFNPPASSAGTALRIVALLGTGYVLAHLFVTNVIVARRIKARDRALAAGRDAEEEWVDEVVHPDER